MKKLFVTLLLLLVCFGTCSCGDNSLLSPKDPVNLTLWHVYGEQADAPMNELVEEFNNTIGAEKGVSVTVTNVTSTSKIGEQLLASQANHPGSINMPDLFSCHTSNANALGYENLVDWSQYFSDEELASYIPEFIAEGKTPDDRFVVFPVSKSTYALYLNGSQFEKFSQATGVTYESLSTWEGFFDAAEKYYNYSGGKPFCAFDYLIRHVELDMLSNGSEVVYTENGWYDIENPALKEAWMMFADALVQGHVIVSDLYANTQVMTGDVLGGIGSSAAIIYFNDTVTYPDNTQEPTNLHALPLPMSAGDVHFMPQTGVGMAAYYTTDQKAEAASVFMRWFTEGARNLDFVAETGYMPVQVSAYDAIDSYAFPNEGYHSLYQAIDVMRQTTTPIIRPTVNGYYKKTNALYDGLRQMQQTWPDRLQDGASKESLMNESWDFFCSIGDNV